LVESQPSKLLVAGSSPVSRSFLWSSAHLLLLFVAMLVNGCIERKPERLAKQESPVTTELAAMVAEEDSLRKNPAVSVERLKARQTQHRQEVYRLMARALIREGIDQYRAALILQTADRSEGPDICLEAHYLAAEAMEKGVDNAAYVAAAALDRYLVLSGRRQRYGTQYFVDNDGRYQLYPLDTTTTDSVRAIWDVPPLSRLRAEIDSLNSQ
jgi:hypothetical protein